METKISKYPKPKSKPAEECLWMLQLLMACRALSFKYHRSMEKEYVHFQTLLAWLIHQYDN